MKGRTLNKLSRIFFFLGVSLVLLVNQLPVHAGLAEDLAEVQKKLAEIRNQKNSIQSQINSDKKSSDALTAEILKLKNQIELLNNQIQEKELIIQELDLQITILTQNIEVTGTEIFKAEGDIAQLEKETDQRMVDIYISEKTFSQFDVFINQAGTDFIKYSVYQDSFQSETNTLLDQLSTKKTELETKKASLEASKLQIVSDQTRLDEEKIALTKTQSELDQQRAYFNAKRNESMNRIQQNTATINIFTEEEQKTLAKQNQIEQELFNSIKNLGSGVYVTKNTIIGQQGYSGYVIPKGPGGAHLHFATKVNNQSVNPCSLLPAGTFSNCAGSGKIAWPMRNPFNYTSGYGMRWGKWHDAIDIASPSTHAYIYAAHDGWMYRGGDFGGGFWRKVCETKGDCSKGVYTFYLHLKD
jgi:hypothetical protein